jgi:hypothetical protein
VAYHLEVEKRNEIVAQDSGIPQVPEDRRGSYTLVDLDDLSLLRIALVRLCQGAPEEEATPDAEKDREDDDRTE